MEHSNYILSIAREDGSIAVTGDFAEVEAATADCNKLGAGAHLVHEGYIVRWHPLTPKSLIGSVESRFDDGDHPAIGYEPENPIACPGDDDGGDDPSGEGEIDGEIMWTPPSLPALPETPQAKKVDAAKPKKREAKPALESVSRVLPKRAPEKYTVRGRTHTRTEWAAILKLSDATISAAIDRRGTTREAEIERRLDMIEKTGSALEPLGPRRRKSNTALGSQPPTNPVSKPAAAPKTDPSDGTLADLRAMLSAAEKHGGIASMIRDAELGLAVRSLVLRASTARSSD